MTVTELVEASASKVKVYIDDEFAFVLYKGELRKYGIKEGQSIKPEDYREIMEEVLPKRAKLRCMNLLKSRDYTTMQLRTKLQQGLYPEKVAEEALAYVASFRYIDDLRYAVDFIDGSHTHKSRKRMEHDLRQRGIGSDTIEKAWAEWEEAGNVQDEEAQIRQLLEKKHFDATQADWKEVQKIYGFLIRRGFSADKIRKVLPVNT